MDTECPRCKVFLVEQEYEGETILFCEVCYGHWLSRAQLDSIVKKVEYKFGRKTEERVMEEMTTVGDDSRVVDESQPVSCPQCGHKMTRNNYVPNCPVQIDECHEHGHGIWLDTGEIKDLQVFVETRILGITH